MTAPTSVLDAPTGVFDRRDFTDDASHEQVVFCQDIATGLKAIIAIHSTTLGPAVGGTRFYPYRDGHAALTDVLRLSRGMTYKAAVAGLSFGGAKGVIIGDPTTAKTPELLRAYGRFVNSLGGRYVTAADVGTTSEDMDIIGQVTDHVAARTPAAGGWGDTAPMTALGVFHAMRAAAERAWGTDDLAGRVVGVEGVGKVGYRLTSLLVDAGADVVASDVNTNALARLESDLPTAHIVDRVIDADLDIYAPCAMGATLTRLSVAAMRARVVCGAANNQLATSDVEQCLHDRGIVWVPDYVANSGGLIQGAGEIQRTPRQEVLDHVTNIGATVTQILELQQRSGISAEQAARNFARTRLQAAQLR